MALAFVLLLSLAAVFYAVLILRFALGFRRVRAASREAPVPPERALPFVSILVPARDESGRIASCLRAILDNDYPSDCFEVIVIDDGSADGTGDRVRALRRAPGAAPVRLLTSREAPATGNKQAALARGVACARGALLLTTDADCLVGPRWIRSMVNTMTPETGFVAGPVRYRPGPTLFGRLQALEFLALVATGAGGIGIGRPNMCNSANVLYRRAVYERFARESRSDTPASDELLAQYVARAPDWNVHFCPHPDAVVETAPLLNLRRFWAQRRRWAGTGPRYPRAALVAAILGVYAFYVLLLAGLCLAPVVPGLAPAAGAAFLLKVLAEVPLVFPACRHFGQGSLVYYFLPAQPVQIVYVVAVGLAAAVGTPTWKGRPAFIKRAA